MLAPSTSRSISLDSTDPFSSLAPFEVRFERRAGSDAAAVRLRAPSSSRSHCFQTNSASFDGGSRRVLTIRPAACRAAQRSSELAPLSLKSTRSATKEPSSSLAPETATFRSFSASNPVIVPRDAPEMSRPRQDREA